MKRFWKFLAWLALACGIITYFIGWSSLITQSIIWGIQTEFWFYDAVAAGIFALFFLIYAIAGDKRE